MAPQTNCAMLFLGHPCGDDRSTPLLRTRIRSHSPVHPVTAGGIFSSLHLPRRAPFEPNTAKPLHSGPCRVASNYFLHPHRCTGSPARYLLQLEGCLGAIAIAAGAVIALGAVARCTGLGGYSRTRTILYVNSVRLIRRSSSRRLFRMDALDPSRLAFPGCGQKGEPRRPMRTRRRVRKGDISVAWLPCARGILVSTSPDQQCVNLSPFALFIRTVRSPARRAMSALRPFRRQELIDGLLLSVDFCHGVTEHIERGDPSSDIRDGPMVLRVCEQAP